MTDHDNAAGPAEPYIKFVNVSKSFDDQTVLRDVSFDVRRGEMVVVLGRSGVGKSVTLKHILGFLQPDAGQVFVAAGAGASKWRAAQPGALPPATQVVPYAAALDSTTPGGTIAS